MSASLTDQFISDGYQGQLHVSTNLSATGLKTVYDGIGVASSLSVAQSGGGASITGALTAGNVIFPSLSSITTLFDLIYPVGSILLTLDNTNPANRFVGTNWEQTSQGKFIVGVGTGVDGNNNSQTFAAGNNDSGNYSIVLSPSQIPDHYHHIASSQVSFENNQRPTANDYVAVAKNPAGVGTFEYGLAGVNTPASLGKTSGVVRTGAISGTNVTSPSYGLYIWRRVG